MKFRTRTAEQEIILEDMLIRLGHRSLNAMDEHTEEAMLMCLKSAQMCIDNAVAIVQNKPVPHDPEGWTQAY